MPEILISKQHIKIHRKIPQDPLAKKVSKKQNELILVIETKKYNSFSLTNEGGGVVD